MVKLFIILWKLTINKITTSRNIVIKEISTCITQNNKELAGNEECSPIVYKRQNL